MIEFTKEMFLNILGNCCCFKREGNLIKTDWKNAFVFMDIMSHVEDGTYILLDGKLIDVRYYIFDRLNSYRTALNIKNKFNFLFEGDKYIVPYNYKSDITKCENCIFVPIRPKRYESFCKFIVGNHFKDMGYLVEDEINWMDIPGQPDLGAYKCLEYRNELIKRGFISGGAFMRELQLINLLGKNYSKKCFCDEKDCAVVFEAKTCQKTTQINKYLNGFDYGFEIVPLENLKNVNSKYYGLISFKDGKLKTVPDLNIFKKGFICEDNKRVLFSRFEKVLKFNLATNLNYKIDVDNYNFYDILDLVEQNLLKSFKN